MFQKPDNVKGFTHCHPIPPNCPQNGLWPERGHKAGIRILRFHDRSSFSCNTAVETAPQVWKLTVQLFFHQREKKGPTKELHSSLISAGHLSAAVLAIIFFGFAQKASYAVWFRASHSRSAGLCSRSRSETFFRFQKFRKPKIGNNAAHSSQTAHV